VDYHPVGDHQPGGRIRPVVPVQNINRHTPRPTASISISLSENKTSRDQVNPIVQTLDQDKAQGSGIIVLRNKFATRGRGLINML
jgi:hypothetical protein